MENKIQELTDKIYREGVEKGNEEAQRLIANAQEEAKKLLRMHAKRQNQSLIPLVNLLTNWWKIQNQS
ncbi:hypothetical protein BFINE_30980 [Bacteroides finegoldii DSM 17565]|nr:hypothetical protein BFINE_30980 [Bacteroides finegoldii DSM 17565]GLL54819.1 hypothetical protein KUBF_24810 [Bacteroides finegoldii]